jgi:hypothetical protein
MALLTQYLKLKRERVSSFESDKENSGNYRRDSGHGRLKRAKVSFKSEDSIAQTPQKNTAAGDKRGTWSKGNGLGDIHRELVHELHQMNRILKDICDKL